METGLAGHDNTMIGLKLKEVNLSLPGLRQKHIRLLRKLQRSEEQIHAQLENSINRPLDLKGCQCPSGQGKLRQVNLACIQLCGD